MKLLTKVLIAISVIVFFGFILLFVLLTIVAFWLEYSVGDNKPENYIAENNLSEIAFNRDGYLYKINDELFISVNYGENFEVKKANKKYTSNYSDLDIYSNTLFEGKDPLNSYYLIKDDKLYIKNNELKKCIDLETSQINDFKNEIDGDWDTLQ